MDEAKGSVANAVDLAIDKAIERYDGSWDFEEPSPIDDLISCSELIDRLSIINFKLYNLKNAVMQNQGNRAFLARAAVIDVHLCEERSRLKNAINHKLEQVVAGRTAANAEQKDYS